MNPSPSVPKPLPADSVEPLQRALGAEHAAVWVYGLVSAFLPAAFTNAVVEGMAAHRARRDTAERMLAASGARPQPAEAAYLPPNPVTDQASALTLLVTAESDSAVAWRAALDRTDDPDLRRVALEALTGSAVRATRWRRAAGTRPAAVPMPGEPS